MYLKKALYDRLECRIGKIHSDIQIKYDKGNYYEITDSVLTIDYKLLNEQKALHMYLLHLQYITH